MRIGIYLGNYIQITSIYHPHPRNSKTHSRIKKLGGIPVGALGQIQAPQGELELITEAFAKPNEPNIFFFILHLLILLFSLVYNLSPL